MGLVEVLVAVGISAIIAAALATIVTNSMQGSRHVELRSDLDAIRRAITDGLDCSATFEENTIADPLDPGLCATATNDAQAPKYLRLRRYAADGKVVYMTPPLKADGSAQIGEWHIRASCSATHRTLVIKAARFTPSGDFALDPLDQSRKRKFDWNHPRSVLFGAAPAIPVCYGKGALTGKIIHGVQRYIWNDVSKSYTVHPLNGTAAAEVDAVTTISTVVGGEHIHGLRCNEARGWKTVSCHVNAVSYALNDHFIRSYSHGQPAPPANGYHFDVDAWMGADQECWTNEVQQFASSNPASNIGISVHVTCVKVGN